MAGKQKDFEAVLYCNTEEIAFSTPATKEASSVTLYASADITQDAEFVYLTMYTIGMHSKPLLRLPGEFMGPFPTLVRFIAQPICGTSGYPRSAKWPASGFLKLMVGSAKNLMGIGRKFSRVKSTHENISWGPDSDADRSAVFSGEVRCWDGLEGLAENLEVPHMTTRYKKWRTLPYATRMSTGFSNHGLEHTFKWRKSGDGQEIGLCLHGRASRLSEGRRDMSSQALQVHLRNY